MKWKRRLWICSVPAIGVSCFLGAANAQELDGFAGLRRQTMRTHWCGTKIPPEAMKAAYSPNLWPNSTVFYVFDASVTPENQQAMLEAMAEISAVADIQFVEYTAEPNYIRILDFDGGYNYSSAVGMSGGEQTIGIESWHRKWVMVHELFHALGMWHEQSRIDRDNYVRINVENIEQGFASQFAIVPSAITNGPYDFDSVMHYDQFAFSTGSRTITVLWPYRKRWQYRLGTRDRPTMGSGDVWVLTHLYGGSPPPRVFELTSPTKGQLVGEGWTPTFTWETAELADNYHLLVDDDLFFGSPDIDVAVAAVTYVHDTALPANRLYYWTVQARNSVGTSEPFVDGSFYTAASVSETLYVDDDAAPGGTGQSWDDAFDDLQDALALAGNVERAVVEIRVAQGTYQPDRGTGDRAVAFDLVGGVAVRGGYAGVGTPDPDQCDPARYRTILTGDLNGDNGVGLSNDMDNSYAVVFALGLESTAVLDGVTVTGSRATDGDPYTVSSGLFLDDSRVTFRRCIFEGNSSPNSGGGMSIAYGAQVNVTDCVFRQNDASNGGALLNLAAEEAVIERSVFADNTTWGLGGAVFSYQSDPWFINCLFTCNTAQEGGAISNLDGSYPYIVNSTFYGNTASTAGALAVDPLDQARLYNCIFWNNGAQAILGPTRITHSCIEDGFVGAGNISVDPSLVDPANQDFRLSPGSPCIDSGSNRSVPSDVETDLVGRPRFVDDPDTADCPVPGASCGTPPIVDMGPYEYAPPVLGDFNGDFRVDLDDHAIFVVCSGSPSNADPPQDCTDAQFDATDLEDDDDVDLGDFAIFQRLSLD